MTRLTPEEARDQLAAADMLATTSGADARIGAFTTAGVGVLVAVVLVMTKVFLEIAMPFSIVMGVVTSALVGLMSLVALVFWHKRHVRVVERGFARRYVASFGITMALYTIGIVWVTGASWAVLAPYCVVVALPMVVVASRMTRQ